MTESDKRRLALCHPTLVGKIDQILTAMAAIGETMKVTDGARTLQQQQALYRQGRDDQGHVVDHSKIVTNADGVLHRSNHQVHDDGYGHAADLAFVGAEPYAEQHPWTLYGMLAKQVGLEWGGAWTSIVDRPHVQLKATA